MQYTAESVEGRAWDLTGRMALDIDLEPGDYAICYGGVKLIWPVRVDCFGDLLDMMEQCARDYYPMLWGPDEETMTNDVENPSTQTLCMVRPEGWHLTKVA